MRNFTAADLVQTTLAILAFALFLLPPGYLLGMAGNFFGLRHRSAAEKLLFGVAFSIATTPVLAVLLTRFGSYKVTLAFFLLLALITVGTLVPGLLQARGPGSGVRRGSWLLFAMLVAWFLLVQLSLADWQIGHRLYVNYVAYDHSVRVPFVEAAARGVPPHNPFYGLGPAPVLRYFYYWYVVCALPVRLFGLPAKACLDASVFWSGLGLAALVPLYLKHFFGECEALREKSLIGMALLSVTGLDLLAYIAWAGYYKVIPPDIEWWDNNQITSWLGSLLWVPHHVASCTACMAGLLALSAIEEDAPWTRNGWAVLLAGLAFASAAGLSIYVVFAFALFLVAWTLLTLAEKRTRSFLAYVASGALSLLLSWPYLLDLLSKSPSALGGGAGGERFAFVGTRDFRPGLMMLQGLGVKAPWVLELGKMPMLVLVYLVEFGFFALAWLLHWRRERQNPGRSSRQRRMAWLLFVICLVVLSFVKSDTSGANDLGFRGMLVVQFVLLLWAAPVVYEVFAPSDAASRPGGAASGDAAAWMNPRWVKVSLVCTLALGVAGSALGVFLLRAYAPLADTGRLKRSERTLGSPGFGARTYWLREGFARLNQRIAPDMTVQFNPVRDEVLIARLYSARQAAMGDAGCGSAFGGDVGRCRSAFLDFAVVFNNPNAVKTWNLDQFCDRFAVPILVATDADPVWQDRASWVWTRPPLLANPMMRMIACGSVGGVHNDLATASRSSTRP